MKIRPGQADRNEKASSVYRQNNRQNNRNHEKRPVCHWAIFSSYERNVAETPLGLWWTALSLIHLWFKNYLSWWLQRVGADGAASQWASVTSDVSQGDLLGPLLFTRSINDLPNASEGKVMTKVTKKSKDNGNFKPTIALLLCQRWQPAGSSSTVFAFYFSVTLSNWGEWSKDNINFNRKKLNARLTMHGKGLIWAQYFG